MQSDKILLLLIKLSTLFKLIFLFNFNFKECNNSHFRKIYFKMQKKKGNGTNKLDRSLYKQHRENCFSFFFSRIINCDGGIMLKNKR